MNTLNPTLNDDIPQVIPAFFPLNALTAYTDMLTNTFVAVKTTKDMKNYLLHSFNTLVAVVVLLMAYDANSQSFSCDANLYQVVDGNHLKVLVPSTGEYVSVGVSSISYNGAGFNTEDGFIYGIASGNTLVKVDNSGEAISLGTIANFSALSYSGDFDTEGNWYSFKVSGGNWIMNTIDVSAGTLEAQESTVTELAGVASARKTNDIAYNNVTKKFYGMDNGLIMEFDAINKTVKTIGDYTAVSDGGGYGAVWSDETGKTYFFNNATGNIFRAAFNEAGNVLSFAFIATSSPNGSNDGMSCSLAQAPVFPEICDNGLDDDGDGLIDCEDPDCTSTEKCGVSGVLYSSTYACTESIATYHAFFTNNSSLTNTVTITDQLADGFVFLQDTLEFDQNGYSSFTHQPVEGNKGTLKWGPITLEGKETVRISYDVMFDEEVDFGSQFNDISASLERTNTLAYPASLSSEMILGECAEPVTYSCEPAFYQVYKKKGKNQPNVFGKLDPQTGDYNAIAIASDFANGLGFDINTGLVYGASGNRFVQLDQDGMVIDQGISFDRKVYRGDVNNNSEWFGVDGTNMVKIDISGTPNVTATYSGQGLPGWDMAYNEDGHFYSIHGTTLYQFNTTTNSKLVLGNIEGSNIPTSGGYGAQWSGSDGHLYASHNASGKILQVNVVTGEARVVSYSTDGLSKNDGFSCPTEIPVVFEFDYGDNSRLPQSKILAYRQDLSNDNIPDFSTFWLGNTITHEAYDLSNTEANGDLDDGVNFSTEINDQAITATIGFNTNKVGLAYYLIGLDWNDDGLFDQIISNTIELSTANTSTESIELPVDYSGGMANARVIIAEVSLNEHNIEGEILSMGEVEDYRFLITEPCTGEDCEVTTGTEGGLESNGSLAGAIAKRNYARAKNNDGSHLKANQIAFRINNLARQSASIEKYFPMVGFTGNEEATVSTPEDLVEITNATNVFAVDYYLSDRRVAASLLLTTESEVYNHSKNVCDRLNGKSIEEVTVTNLDGISVVLAKIMNTHGAVEYSAWFSAKETEDQYEIYSLWNVDNYPAGKYLNFQAWSSSPAQVFHVLKYALNQLKTNKTVIGHRNTQQLPDVFVQSGQYNNGKLELTIVNNAKSDSIEVISSQRSTEQSSLTEFAFEVALSGEKEQVIQINTGYLFDAGISLRVKGAQAYDALYLADGAWGTDFNEDLSDVNSFNIEEVNNAPKEDEYLVERGFELTGYSSDVINVFRNLKAGEKSLNVEDFSSISFDIANNTAVEVILVEKGLVNWNNRLRISIPAHVNKQEVTLSLNQFGIESLDSKDIQTLVFSYMNSIGEEEKVELAVTNIRFGNAQVLASEKPTVKEFDFTIFPNPATDYIKIRTSELSVNGVLSILDLGGRVMMTETVENNGEDATIKLTLSPGLYQVIYKGNSSVSSKLLKVQ